MNFFKFDYFTKCAIVISIIDFLIWALLVVSVSNKSNGFLVFLSLFFLLVVPFFVTSKIVFSRIMLCVILGIPWILVIIHHEAIWSVIAIYVYIALIIAVIITIIYFIWWYMKVLDNIELKKQLAREKREEARKKEEERKKREEENLLNKIENRRIKEQQQEEERVREEKKRKRIEEERKRKDNITKEYDKILKTFPKNTSALIQKMQALYDNNFNDDVVNMLENYDIIEQILKNYKKYTHKEAKEGLMAFNIAKHFYENFEKEYKSIFFELKVTSKKTIKSNDGQMVQSEGERMIANFLFRHQIDYDYDKQITLQGNEPDKNGLTKRWVRPDFLLPEFALVIEYWGRRGEPDYDKDMALKKRLYAESKTKYISFSPNDLPKINEFLKNKLNKQGLNI